MNLFSEGETQEASQGSFTASQRGVQSFDVLNEAAPPWGCPRHCRKAAIPGSWPAAPTVGSALWFLQATTTQMIPYPLPHFQCYPGSSAIHHLEPQSLLILYQWINGGPEKGRNLPKSQARHTENREDSLTAYHTELTHSTSTWLGRGQGWGRTREIENTLSILSRRWEEREGSNTGNLWHSSTF